MSNNQFNLTFETELNEGMKVTTLTPVLCSGDNEAHSFIVKAMRNGKPVSLSGATVRGFFIRPDNVTITLDGTVNASGEAVVTLSDSCYNKQGRFQITICATIDGVTSTLFCGIGGMLLASTDSFIDEGNVVPSLDDLLAQIDAMKEATAAALEAADRANEAAENAGSSGGYPVVGYVDANNNIILTSDDLAAGTYTFKYENADGTQTEIGTAEVSSTEDSGDDNTEEGGDDTATYTNQIPISIDTDGSVYNSIGYKDGYRLNSSGAEAVLAGTAVTGFIPVKYGDTVRLKNVAYAPGVDSTGDYLALYDSSFNSISSSKSNQFYNADHIYTNATTDSSTGYLTSFVLDDESLGYAYLRVSAAGLDSTAIITVNEEIA